MPSHPLLIATGNPHKFDEIARFLDGVPWRLAGLREFPPCDAPEEVGDSFEANAVIKALAYCERFGVACVADDSGLVVDALDGAPGIRSARYAGDKCNDADNNAKLLAALEDVPGDKRTARFVCCCAFVTPGYAPHIERGEVEGNIAWQVTGAHGFGYDPLFVQRGYDRSFGELDPAIKAAISHRARAFEKLRAFLIGSTA